MKRKLNEKNLMKAMKTDYGGTRNIAGLEFHKEKSYVNSQKATFWLRTYQTIKEGRSILIAFLGTKISLTLSLVKAYCGNFSPAHSFSQFNNVGTSLFQQILGESNFVT